MIPIIISKRNSKLGNIPNFSLPPGVGCGLKLPCSKICYARKFYRMYSTVKAAWNMNWQAVRGSLLEFKNQVIGHPCFRKNQARFRIHVSGDFFRQKYLDTWLDIVRARPSTRFLAFTKRYDLVFPEKLPENLTIVVSRWPGDNARYRDCVKAHPHIASYPQAFMLKRGEEIPEALSGAYPCKGSCSKCSRCWDIRKGEAVVFHEH